ncbi:MAG: PilN domain-containing protein [Chthoniobacterales bacterium]
MALHLNLLHEEILQQRQRQRDPLKIGMMVLGALGSVMLAYYMWNAYKTLEIRNRLGQAQQEWAKVEPKVTAAQKRSAELNSIISTTKVLDGMIDSRFFWAPVLEKLSKCVALNAQLTSVDGAVQEDGKISLSVDGLAAGREPRAAAEELRQLLLEQLGQTYGSVKVEFKSLEDLDTIVNIGGANMAMARFTMSATFAPTASKPTATPGPRTKAPRS